MKPQASDVQTVSTVATGAQVMTIDPAGMRFILKTLSELYSNPFLALVREYASNALDSHIEAGNTGPILITAPTSLSPLFVVQDFGVGLSRQEVLDVYAQYGASTKRDTNEQIGSFGVGAKSAFAVSTQFIVTAVKEGEQTVALFALNDDGAPTVNIIRHEVDVFEPNGVKVEIGVSNISAVNEAILRLFPTWKRGTVLVDGVEPASVWDNAEELDTDIALGWREDQHRTRDQAWVVVMGGVPYHLPGSVIRTFNPRVQSVINSIQNSPAQVYLTVPIGSVDITPSREDLVVTEKTTGTISALVEKFLLVIGPWISKQVEDADSLIAALIAHRKVRAQLGNVDRGTLANVTWRGKALPTTKLTWPTLEWFELGRKRGSYYGEQVARRYKTLELHPSEHFERYLFVTNVPERRVRSVQLAAKPFLAAEDGKNGIARVVALTQPLSSYSQDWFSLTDKALKMIDYDSFIKQWKPAATPAQRGEVRYSVYGENRTFSSDELRKLSAVFYVENSYERWVGRVNQKIRLMTTGTAPVVILTAQQKVSAFLKRVPQGRELREAMGVTARNLLTNLSPQDQEMLFARDYLRSADTMFMNYFVEHESEITNASVLHVVKRYKEAQTAQNQDLDRMNLLRAASEFLNTPLVSDRKYRSDLELLNRVVNGLPLLYAYIVSNRHHRTPLGNDHAIRYVNSTTI